MGVYVDWVLDDSSSSSNISSGGGGWERSMSTGPYGSSSAIDHTSRVDNLITEC